MKTMDPLISEVLGPAFAALRQRRPVHLVDRDYVIRAIQVAAVFDELRDLHFQDLVEAHKQESGDLFVLPPDEMRRLLSDLEVKANIAVAEGLSTLSDQDLLLFATHTGALLAVAATLEDAVLQHLPISEEWQTVLEMRQLDRSSSEDGDPDQREFREDPKHVPSSGPEPANALYESAVEIVRQPPFLAQLDEDNRRILRLGDQRIALAQQQFKWLKRLAQCHPDKFEGILNALQAENDAIGCESALPGSRMEHEKRFHGLLELANADPGFVSQVHQVWTKRGVVPFDAVYRSVVSEHQRIIDALRDRDFNRAVYESSRHFDEAFKRWFPGVTDTITKCNASWFDELARGEVASPTSTGTLARRDCLIVCTVDALPIEWKNKDVGKRAAFALGRGATIDYTYSPAFKRLKSGSSDRRVDGDAIRTAFASFRKNVEQCLAESPLFSGKVDESLQRLQLLHLDSRPLAKLVGRDSTLGCFHFEHWATYLTRRRRFRGEVWHCIEHVSRPKLPRFCDVLCNAINTALAHDWDDTNRVQLDKLLEKIKRIDRHQKSLAMHL